MRRRYHHYIARWGVSQKKFKTLKELYAFAKIMPHEVIGVIKHRYGSLAGRESYYKLQFSRDTRRGWKIELDYGR